MKIAKKVLAVVMAVALVACFSAMAFAAEGKIVLKAGDVVDGKVKVQAVATGCSDLKTGDWVLTYDAAALKLTATPGNGTGDLTQIVTDKVAMAVMQSLLVTAYNDTEAGKVQVGFAFQNTLGSDDETPLFTAEFEVIGDAKNVEVSLATKEGEAVDSLVLLKEEAPVETTTAAPETEAKTEAPSTEAPTTAAGKTDGDNKTGDTGVLAIAAGVVALAGAAFVVSKKRK